MRRNLLAVVVAVGVLSSGPNVSVVAAESQPAPILADRFPLPSDAVIQRSASKDGSSKKAASGDRRITVYEVPRGRHAVVAETRATLKTRNWQIVKDDSSAGSAVRLTVKKDGATWKASFTGDDTRAVIVVIAPAS